MASKLTSTQAAAILPRNTQRKSLAIQNQDSTDSVYVKKEQGEALTVSSTDHDWKLVPGASISVNEGLDGKQAIQERYTVIASANTPRIAYFESEDIIR